MSTITTRGTVTIAKDRCKGCELCIPVCPPKVLTMSTALNQLGVPYPELIPGCTGCGACHLICPDLCFEVYSYDSPVEFNTPKRKTSDDASGAIS